MLGRRGDPRRGLPGILDTLRVWKVPDRRQRGERVHNEYRTSKERVHIKRKTGGPWSVFCIHIRIRVWTRNTECGPPGWPSSNRRPRPPRPFEPDTTLRGNSSAPLGEGRLVNARYQPGPRNTRGRHTVTQAGHSERMEMALPGPVVSSL